MGKKLHSGSFLDEAEKIIRSCAKDIKDPEFVIWRGKLSSEVFPQETIIAGLSDEKNKVEPPAIRCLTVSGSYDHCADIEFRENTGIIESQSVPFGGGWSPLDEVEKMAKRLPGLFS